MSNVHTPDEVTFALYYDDELTREEASQFEASVEADPDLLARYEQWVQTQEGLVAHFEQLEAGYSLEGFTERVMGELPADAPWLAEALDAAPRAVTESAEGNSWVKRLLFPLLIGSLTAAVILFIVDRRGPEGQGVGASNPSAPQNNTTLIKDSEVKVTWLEDEESEDDLQDDEDDKGDEGI